jgi:hypothetical protein
MSKRTLAVALTLTLVAAAGWALAQQDQPVVPPPAEGATVPQPVAPAPSLDVPAPPRAGRLAGSGTPGRYAVALSGERGLLVDTATGKTWDLARSADGRAAWLPARRLDADKDVQQWFDQQRQQGAARLEQEHQKARYAAEVARAQRERVGAEAQQAKLRDELRRTERRLKELQAQQDQARAEQERLRQFLRELNPPDAKKGK